MSRPFLVLGAIAAGLAALAQPSPARADAPPAFDRARPGGVARRLPPRTTAYLRRRPVTVVYAVDASIVYGSTVAGPSPSLPLYNRPY